MASLLTEPLFQVSGVGRPPNKNFYHFTVTRAEVIWRWWKISMRAVDRFSRPGELKESHEDFLDDSWLQSEVSAVFGRGILLYTEALCRGRYDYLDHLPDPLLLRIIHFLELEDVEQLGQTSRRFRRLCGSEDFWEGAVRRCCNSVSEEVASLAQEVGWRCVFFTNKLQLQKLLRRRRRPTEERREEADAGGRGSPDGHAVERQTSSSEDEGQHSAVSDLSLSSGSEAGSNADAEADADAESRSASSEPGLFLQDVSLF